MSDLYENQPAASKSLHTKSTGRRSDKEFAAIMADTTHAMPRYKKLFSAFIHIRIVSLLSDIVGTTIARPNSFLFGSIFSFTTTIGIYLLAKNFGYSMSGFESIGAFLVGWTIGLLFDLIQPIKKKKR